MVRLVPLLAAAAFMLSGAYAMNIEPNGLPGVALLISGLITLGAWIAVEAYQSIDAYKEKQNNDTPK